MTGALAAVASSVGGAGGVYVEPAFVFGSGMGPVVTSELATAYPAGTTYSWQYVAGDAITCNTPLARTTTFSYAMSPGQSALTTYRLVTPGGSFDVSVTLECL